MDCCFFLEGGGGGECWLFKLGTYLFFIPTAGRLGGWVVIQGGQLMELRSLTK